MKMNISFRPSSVYFGTQQNNITTNNSSRQEAVQQYDLSLFGPLNDKYRNKGVKTNPELRKKEIEKLNQENEKLKLRLKPLLEEKNLLKKIRASETSGKSYRDREFDALLVESEDTLKRNDTREGVVDSNIQKIREKFAENKLYLTYLNQLESKIDEKEIQKAARHLHNVFTEKFGSVNVVQERIIEDELLNILSSKEIGVRPSCKNGDSFSMIMQTVLKMLKKK